MTASRPIGLINSQNQYLIQSFKELSYRGDLDGGPSLVYIGFARPGSLTSAAVWQIMKLAYSGTTPISILWPQNSSGNATNDFVYIWDNRAALIFS